MKQALLNGFYISSTNKTAERITPEALPQIKQETDYIWIQLDFTAPETMQILQSLDISEQSMHALIQEESRPRNGHQQGGITFSRSCE